MLSMTHRTAAELVARSSSHVSVAKRCDSSTHPRAAGSAFAASTVASSYRARSSVATVSPNDLIDRNPVRQPAQARDADGMTATDAPRREICDECGFDALEWPRARATKELAGHGEAWASTFDGRGADALRRRPDASVWSAVEYAVHTARVLEFWSDAIADMVDGKVVTIDMEGYPDADAHPYNDVAPPDAIDDLRRQLSRLAAFGGSASETAWAAPLHVEPAQLEAMFHAEGISDAGSSLLHALHDAMHHLSDVERGLAKP